MTPSETPPPGGSAIGFCTLASGSSGNAAYFETPHGALLVDAGISCKRIVKRLNCVGRTTDALQGVLITHSHSDHVRAAGTVARRFGVPLLMSAATEASCAGRLGRGCRIEALEPGATTAMAGFEVHAVPTPHDVDGALALILEAGACRVGLFTDLGHVFPELPGCLQALDALLIESNYEPDLLASNPRYPPHLKARIRGPGGHLSNQETSALLRDHAGARLRTIVLSHLSEHNNHPELALQRFFELAETYLAEHAPLVTVAPRHEPSEIFAIDPLPTTPAAAL